MKILVGYDGSNAGKDAIELAISHAKAFNADIEVVASLIGGSVTEVVEIRHAEEDMAYAKNRIEKEGIACSTHVLIRNMAPGEDVVQFAEENSVDEIIIGIKRRSKVGKLLFGSNAQYIILNAPCPVVSVK